MRDSDSDCFHRDRQVDDNIDFGIPLISISKSIVAAANPTHQSCPSDSPRAISTSCLHHLVNRNDSMIRRHAAHDLATCALTFSLTPDRHPHILSCRAFSRSTQSHEAKQARKKRTKTTVQLNTLPVGKVDSAGNAVKGLGAWDQVRGSTTRTSCVTKKIDTVKLTGIDSDFADNGAVKAV